MQCEYALSMVFAAEIRCNWQIYYFDLSLAKLLNYRLLSLWLGRAFWLAIQIRFGRNGCRG